MDNCELCNASEFIVEVEFEETTGHSRNTADVFLICIPCLDRSTGTQDLWAEIMRSRIIDFYKYRQTIINGLRSRS